MRRLYQDTDIVIAVNRAAIRPIIIDAKVNISQNVQKLAFYFI